MNRAELETQRANEGRSFVAVRSLAYTSGYAQRPILAAVIAVLGFAPNTFAQKEHEFEPPDDIAFRSDSIISEGTRMAAEVFSLKGATDKLPTIVMSHGWGGRAEHLRPDGVAFARAGFLVVTFDYRGWGKSDARLISRTAPATRDGKLVAEVSEVRGVVDPIDQTTDILNALHWVRAENLCDPRRIGIWGSSFSGGHVVYVAARDPRVKAFVSQVGSMDARWVIQNPQLRELTFGQATQRTRGEIGYPEPFAKFSGMTGQPVWEKLMRYAPIEDINRCNECAKLFIIAENEELFDNKDHAVAAYNRANGVKKLVSVKGIQHYGIYSEKRKEAQQLAIDWFTEHLKKEGQTVSGTDGQSHSKSAATHGFPATAFEYAKMVEPDLGVPPRIDLDKAVDIPLYVNGVQAWGNLGHDCDNPTFLGKDTVSGSRLQRYVGKTADGKPLANVVWVAFGRNSSENHKHVVGSVQMIGYNRTTGATAFFESSDRIGPWVTLDKDTFRMRGLMPGIDEPDEFNRAFRTPGKVQCVECHQSDPFITNAFINAAKIPGTDESVVPVLNRDSPYYVIGGDNWDMRTIHLKGNACFECHRVGMSTMTMFMKNGWKPNEHMPPHDPGSLAKDLRQLLTAWDKGPENVPNAEWIIPPARGKDSQVVGDDYLHQAAFNRPNKGWAGEKPKPGESLEALGARLKRMVASGDLTTAEALKIYEAAAGGKDE